MFDINTVIAHQVAGDLAAVSNLAQFSPSAGSLGAADLKIDSISRWDVGGSNCYDVGVWISCSRHWVNSERIFTISIKISKDDIVDLQSPFREVIAGIKISINISAHGCASDIYPRVCCDRERDTGVGR